MLSASILIHISLSSCDQGLLSISLNNIQTPIWQEIRTYLRRRSIDFTEEKDKYSLSWVDTLDIVREYGSREIQISYNFRFTADRDAAERIRNFIKQIQNIKKHKAEAEASLQLSEEEIQHRLCEIGFTKRKLKPFQLRDLRHLLSLENGANFSVPGAGKTTVTFALHMLIQKTAQCLLVVAPKSAIQAWKDIVAECMADDAPNHGNELFSILDGTNKQIMRQLQTNSRFVISYDLLSNRQSTISNHIAKTPTHMVLDESHRMKAGWRGKRGATALRMSVLPIRRDILSGTPMPQGLEDIVSQVNFLWPGHGLAQKIDQGEPPKKTLSSLFVRTKKNELNLPTIHRHFVDISMNDGQLVLYSAVRNEFISKYATEAGSLKKADGRSLRQARRSVMRLLQLSINPVLAVTAMGANRGGGIDNAIVDQVMAEGHSAKMHAVMQHARALAAEGEKCVIWTIFTDTIDCFYTSLADLNPVFIHGGVPSGAEGSEETREGRIKRFHRDSSCSVLIANPAATGEGINLHEVCHNAIYADRSYVSTHYLQSTDRIHRLGLPENQETNIYIYRSIAPAEIGSIDFSVSRRLLHKIREMNKLLDDLDLHTIALDEEDADDPIDYSVDIQDIQDLIAEIQQGGTPTKPPMQTENI